MSGERWGGSTLAVGPRCAQTEAVSSVVPRTLDQVRETIGSMPFVQAVGLEVEFADEGVGVVSIPLSDVVTYDGTAFAAIAVGLVADVAAGAATLRTLPVDEMALTAGVDSTMTASTRGDRLSARARLRERDETRLIFDAIVEVSSVGREPRECGRGVVTMRVARRN